MCTIRHICQHLTPRMHAHLPLINAWPPFPCSPSKHTLKVLHPRPPLPHPLPDLHMACLGLQPP
jgi:hypothetical protein